MQDKEKKRQAKYEELKKLRIEEEERQKKLREERRRKQEAQLKEKLFLLQGMKTGFLKMPLI